MNSEIRELYQEILLDHNKHPRRRGKLEGANRHGVGHNPLCGDQVLIDVQTVDGTIVDIRFDGCGCAISTASASMMTDLVHGKSVAEARELCDHMQKAFTGIADTETVPESLEPLMGVREFPMRVKCASLAWHTLSSALSEEPNVVSTEN